MSIFKRKCIICGGKILDGQQTVDAVDSSAHKGCYEDRVS